MLAPLYSLLQKGATWSWSPEQKKAFWEAEIRLTSSCVLTHYDPQKQLVLACGASPYGLGAVLSHCLDDGSEKTVAFASRSLALAAAEKRYAQLGKEALAIIFGVKKFHQFLLGRKFTIISYHKPLQHLFSEAKPVPVLASARIKCWALILNAYDYKVEYKPGLQHSNEDALSRSPLPESIKTVPQPGETIVLMENLQVSPVDVKQICQWTSDWSKKAGKQLMTNIYDHTKAEKRSSVCKTRVKGRVIILQAGHDNVLDILHDGHPGTSRMKELARSSVWWPKTDAQIEQKVKHYVHYNKDHQLQRRHTHGNGRIILGKGSILTTYMRKMFLVAIDAHSRMYCRYPLPPPPTQFRS